jgi:hypothetical protein
MDSNAADEQNQVGNEQQRQNKYKQDKKHGPKNKNRQPQF